MSQAVLIAISGKARAGKDTFANLLIAHLISLNQPVARHAFADQLKRELESEIRAKYGISVWTQDSAEKAIIRDDLVAHGRKRREESNGTHWVKQIDPAVRAGLKAGIHQIITDCRYARHEADEAGWVKSLGGHVLYVERVLEDGSILEAANSEERENDPFVKAAASVIVKWPTFQSDALNQQRPYVLDAWTQLTQPSLTHVY